jgi:hypothetical protein
MASLLALLEDLVFAEFGAGELLAVRQRVVPLGDDAPPSAVAKRFLEALALEQRRKPQQVYVWAGTKLVAPILKVMPAATGGHTSTRTMLLQLSQLLPRVVAEFLPGSACPEFWGDLQSGDVIRVGFDGAEELAWVVEGAVHGLAAHFGEEVDVTHAYAPRALKDRRLLDVWVIPKSRPPVRPNSPARGLSSA